MKAKLFSLVSIILTFILVFSGNVFASQHLAGDINGNSVIEAADARLVLRYSVGLEEFDEAQLLLADVDKKDGITAYDARTILRMSVGLEDWIYISDEAEESFFEVHFIDVGQADCSLIICDGETLLIDGGNVADSSLVVSYLLSEGVEELDYVINTHAHEDHVGGLNGPLNKFTVTEAVFAPETGADTDCYNDFLTAVEKQGLELTVPEAGDSFELGSSLVTFIAPIHEEYSNLNNTSIVVKITYEETSFLFTGDIEREAEEDILAAGFDISADVLKVGHHGSETSTTYPFLREVMPEIAVISVAEGKYGHPAEAVLSRFRDSDTRVYRTDMQGHIKITSDGKTLTVTTNKNQDIETNPTIPSPPAQNTSYIGNKNSLKFHYEDCSSLPKEENRVYFTTREDAVLSGYSPCGKCKP